MDSRNGLRPVPAAPRLLKWGALAVIVLLWVLVPRPVRAFGDSGAFHPRVLLVGNATLQGPRTTAPARWAAELTRRTSAPARLAVETVHADAQSLMAEPFAYWMGDRDPGSLSPRELAQLRRFFTLGGLMFVDDTEPGNGAFGKGARRELGRVLTDVSPIPIGVEHVVFRSFYLLRKPAGRVAGPAKLDAIIRSGRTQVIFSSHDLAGALAVQGGQPAMQVTPGGEEQRENAIRMAVNIAMVVLCSNYKDDQVHAPFLMRRRARDSR